MYDAKIREQNFQSYINFWTNNKFYEQNEQDNGEEDGSYAQQYKYEIFQ